MRSPDVKTVRLPLRTVWRYFLLHIMRASVDRSQEYRNTGRWLLPIGSLLFPLYGVFCEKVLHTREEHGMRLVASGIALGLWLLGRLKHRAVLLRFAWILGFAWCLLWLPWHLYLLNDRNSYWTQSLHFFVLALALLLRGRDRLYAALLGAGMVWMSHSLALLNMDFGPLAVSGITLWITGGAADQMFLGRKRLARQSRDLARKNLRLQELDRRKDEFTAVVAHDLRTPLAVAMSVTEELTVQSQEPHLQSRVLTLSTALKQMQRQCEELLDLERFQLGVARLDVQELDALEWLLRFESGLSIMARSRGLTFQVVPHDNNLMARFDPIRLETAVYNLVSNAFKFTPSGGHIEIRLRREANRTLVVAVLDDGEGIPSVALPRIFDRYQQVDRGPGTYTVGAGIGLALVQEIAQAHGGHVKVESTPTLGSLFEIYLPQALLMEQAPNLAPAPMPRPSPHPVHVPRAGFPLPDLPGRLALVIEDDPGLRHIIRDLMDGIVRCATARDGREGLRLAHELRPDIIVSDQAMPGMTGLELFAALRSDPAFANTPFVMLTGDTIGMRERLGADPLVKILSKPFQRAAMVETIHHLLGDEPVSDYPIS